MVRFTLPPGGRTGLLLFSSWPPALVRLALSHCFMRQLPWNARGFISVAHCPFECAGGHSYTVVPALRCVIAHLSLRLGRRRCLLLHRGLSALPRSRGLIRPRFARSSLPSKYEGAGKTGCALHPRSRVRFALN